jgi:hypothetical protein
MKIKLPCGLVTQIDEVDKALLDIFPHWRSNKGRVIITRYLETEYGRVRQDVYLARAIVKPPGRFAVDHADRDPLNNRRYNLRIATKSQNMVNRSKESNKTSKYFGVSLAKAATKNPWRVFMRRPDGSRLTASFPCEVSAAKFFDIESKKAWGEFAPRNF